MLNLEMLCIQTLIEVVFFSLYFFIKYLLQFTAYYFIKIWQTGLNIGRVRIKVKGQNLSKVKS